MKENCCGNSICNGPLFTGLDCEDFHEFYSTLRVKRFEKGEIVAREGSVCSSVGIVIKGKIAMQRITTGGEYATIALLSEGDFFGEDIIYGSVNTYSTTLEAMSSCMVQFISKENLNKLMITFPTVKDNYLRILSDRISSMNHRIELLSQKTLREKIAYYLMDLYNRERKSDESFEECEGCALKGADSVINCKYSDKSRCVTLPVSKEIVAKLLAMPRPSFSRELIAMEKDGLIKVNGREIIICNPARLETEIVEGLSNS